MKKLLVYSFSLFLLIGLWSCSKDDSFSRKLGESEISLDTALGSYSDADGSSTSTSGSGSQVDPGQLTAGEWNDLDNWSFWTTLMENPDYGDFRAKWEFFPDKRYSVLVRGANGLPLNDCIVRLKNTSNDIIWEARTDNFGKAELWAGLYTENNDAFKIVADYFGMVSVNYNPVMSENGLNQLLINFNSVTEQKVDIAFVVDATGSMGDELEYLKTELNDVITRVKFGNENLNLRLGSIFYRDQGDDYVTKISPFDSNIATTNNFINAQFAGGGGNFPEAVHSALEEAVDQLEWSPSAVSRIIFLLLDAPPHHQEDVIRSLHNSVRDAAKKGIKIIPVTASGINKETEFLMRFFELATNSTYVFITNHSGIGNEHIEATVGEYEVEYLNDLMVRLVKKYVE